MKIREDYEQVGWRKLIHWVNADLQEDYISKDHVIHDQLHLKENAAQEKNKRIDELKSSLQALAKTHGKQWYEKSYRIFSIFVAVAMIIVLLGVVSQLPSFGDPSNPANNEVSERYIESGLQETGAVNIVAGMILDYRAFDTLGESHVLFIAAVSVLILLRMDYGSDGKLRKTKGIRDEGYDRMYEPRNDLILQTVTRLLFPMIVLFGIYVILNGHISAGGGFSGGAIVGAALILYNNAFGFNKTKRFFTYNTFKWVSFASLITYALLKTYSFYTGANHLHSGIPLGEPGAILSSGLILPLNICVGCVVACTMYTFFTMFRKGGM
ncbi:MAG: hypothetical protein IJ356_03155 [Erysipelotrichaceae bacterium]|nr:hypothetical protein [Erysipelotrichaceae bacterium]